MPLQTRPRILSLALKSLFGAVATAVVLSSAQAAGLGKLTVLSALGQPLRAEIELTSVSPEEAAGLVAKLAPADAFKLANVEFNPALMGLRFTVEQRGGRQYINITSSQPVNEPFVDMLLELSWSSGRLVREYTFLLDPAEMRSAQSPQVASSPVDVLNQGSRPLPPARMARQGGAASPATAQAQQQQQQQAAPRQRAERSETAAADKPARDSSGASEVKVRPGDTLGRIAARVKPTEISLDMMLVALYRANPDAFVGNNMNRLKSGQILTVPDSDAIKGGSEGEARGVVVAHAADFNAYRNKLAGQVANGAPAKAPEAAQSAAGKVTAKVEERPTAANESKDQLKLSKAGAGGAAAGGKAAADAEDKIAKERALADASARVKELEKNVNDLEKLMVVKSKAGTDASKTSAETAASAAASAPAAAVAPAVPAPAPVAAAPVKPAAKPAVKLAPPAEPTLVETLMDNIVAIIAGLALVVGGGVLLARRRKKDGVLPTEPSILGAPTDQPQSMFAETGGASVDTSNSVFNSSFAPSASQLDTNEVDPIAEADVYIAYGRDAQAEEILKEALRNHPERHAVRLKLLEIYAARKDQRSFEAQASELYSLTRGHGEDWAQAAALGLSIDPNNPLYAGAETGAAAPVAAGVLSAESLAEQDVLHQVATSGDSFNVDHAATAVPDNTLDFDLGSLSFDEPPPAIVVEPDLASHSGNDMDFTSEPIATTAAAAAPTAEEETFDLAFDMDFDKPAAASAAPELKSLDNIHLDLANPDLPTDVTTVDLSNAFDLPTLPGSPESAAVPVAASFGAGAYSEAAPLVNPLDDLDAMHFDLPTSPAVSETAAPETVITPTLEDDPFALPDFTQTASPAVNLHAELPELAFASPDAPAAPSFAAPTPAYTSAPHFDMSGIDLDLPSETPLHEGVTGVPAAEVAGAAGEPSAAHMEMETKLDLAIAYQEIGDKEGARELLDEVIKGGSSDQISRANEMRVKMS
ncbi:MAG: FimV/HubP family polar landmark protein [Massilia sp.]